MSSGHSRNAFATVSKVKLDEPVFMTAFSKVTLIRAVCGYESQILKVMSHK